MNDRPSKPEARCCAGLLPFLLGALVGGLAVGLGFWFLLPGKMIVEHESKLAGFDETVTAIQTSIEEHGWASPGTVDLKAAMARRGVEFGPRVKIIQMCNPTYAKQVLQGDRYMSSMMPCRVAVYEKDGGGVGIAKMNTGLMAKMFGGTVAEVMGGPVAVEELEILEGIVAE